MTSESTIIYTDGACLGNPGPGGYAALILAGGAERVIAGNDAATTNNRMEMLAAIKALEALDPGAAATLHSDSNLLIHGMNEWLTGWKARGWKKADKKPVLNVDLWQQLDALNTERRITWRWIKGHAGHVYNERVDTLANMEAGKAFAGHGSPAAA